ncbi:MAG TPA: exopolysaccharide biosynthesis polyprenyl glycosylphosphotransferase [Opitutaceae bacterium]|nr:exopolysaccharide biosynthesis polyprenyl glycosylphosphotransferase [Opitutaceae bacterium]
MIDRRSSGVASLHTVLLAGEAVLWWCALAAAVPHFRGLEFTSLLPFATYPAAIGMSVLIAMNPLWQHEGSLTALGWANSMRLSFRQTMTIAGAVFTVVVGLKDPGISRVFLAGYFSTLAAGLILLNRYQPGLLVRVVFAGGARLPTLVLGDETLFPELAKWLSFRSKLGFAPVGVVRYRGKAPSIPGLDTVGEFDTLKTAIAKTRARQVLMLSLPHSAEDAERLARVCASCGCRLLIHNNLTFRLTYPLRVLAQDGYSFLAFRDEPLEDPLNRVLKRVLDLLVALVVVVIVVPPVGLCVWLFQRRQAPGPLFYRQLRYGRAGQSFSILKFRTMHADAMHLRQVATDDDRVYPFGRLLRRTSLDELPQFINVLRGDMSVVGPRPHFIRHDETFADAVNEYRVRYFVKPGITGLAQSRGFRGAISTAEAIRQRLQLDLDYIHNWSIWLDVAIIARTARQIVRPPPMAR